MSQLPNGLITFGPLANCTLDLCPLEASLLRYRPSIPATAVFIAIFGLSMVVHAFQGYKSKTWGFMSSMLAGCILEIIGYVGRLIIYNNPFDFNGFLMQISMSIRHHGMFGRAGISRGKSYRKKNHILTYSIVCITVAPVFFSAAIYVLLSQV